MYYRVRKSWDDPKSQLGAYTVLQNAIKKCNENPGYSVYDESGKVVHKYGEVTIKTMSYKAKLKKKINSKHPKGQSVTVHRNTKREWLLNDGTKVPNRKEYLDLTKQIYNSKCKYSKADAENFVNKRGTASKTDWLFWCNKYGQRVYIFKGSKGKWVLKKTFACGTGDIKYGDGSDQGIGFNNWKIFDKTRAFKGLRGIQYYNMHYSSPTGNCIHKGTTGKPSTHGCIALGPKGSKWAFDNLPIGTKVIVY